MAIDRKIVPGVQEIMGLQSDPRNLGILRMLQVMGPQTLSSQAQFFNDNGVSLEKSHLVHLNPVLETALLLKRPQRNSIVPTVLGNTSVDAFLNYRAELLPVANEARERRLVSEYGQDEGHRLAGLYPAAEQDFGMEPRVLSVMKLQSHEDAMRILLLLLEGQATAFSDLREKAIGIPNSSLSNINARLERASLIERKPAYKVTELGVLSVRVFYDYQDKIFPELVSALEQQLEDEYITLPSGLTL